MSRSSLSSTPGLAFAALGLLLGAGVAHGQDDRTIISNTEAYPWNTVSALRYDQDYDGDFEFRGSAAVVGPYVALTCGHCVYKRDEGIFATSDIHVAPAMYEDLATGDAVYPYGTRLTIHKRTNDKYADPTYSPSGDVDYGAVQWACPFEDLTTFMPLVYDYDATYVNMSGYPTEDLPDPSRALDQWWDADPVTDLFDRRLFYEARSTGGASGAPVWAYNAVEGRRLVAVNYGHGTATDGHGSRLVWNNEALIESWLDWRPTFAEKLAAGCAFELEALPFDGLIDYYLEHRWELLSARRLRLVAPPGDPGGQPLRRIYQVIENTLYLWEELARDPHSPDSPVYLRMLRPERRWLSLAEARVLRTASMTWVDEVPAGKNLMYGPPLSEEPLLMPLDLDGESPPDLRPDEPVGK